uniref:DUF4220 domain-containing protein n=1 Tax=Oryza barthii TaxID=65489 RepID=A0A0D3HE89_9ORYZ
MASIFIRQDDLTPGFIQFIVALTTLLMVIRFGLDALWHRSRDNISRVYVIFVCALLDRMTHTMITYSLGIMQHRSATTNYYQLWAVLMVTLRYSVKIGSPAGMAMKQTPLVDLMSSFWAAHILRSHDVSMLLKVPVWLLWSINSARIIHGFISSGDAKNVQRENMKMLTDYMRHEHTTVPVQRPDPSSMKGYRYLVLGEAKKLKKREAEQGIDSVEATETISRILLALTDENNQELVTLERIWSHQGRCSHDGCQCNLPPGCCDILDQKTKDLCLSFALYKLLRRRFFNFPIHEARPQKTRRLVVNGILGEGDAAGRSVYAIIFTQGFPWVRLVLSTLLIGGISTMAVAVHRFSKSAKEDELGRAHIHHGVYFTWVILSLLGAKEIWEMTTYVFSDWTKVLLLCKFIEQPWWMRCWVGNLARALMRMLLCSPPLFRRWHGKVNLLFSRHSSIHLSKQVKKAVVDSLKNSIRQNLRLNNYLEQAINKNSLSIRLVRPSDNQEQEQAPQNSQADGGHRVSVEWLQGLQKKSVEWQLQDDVHTLLVWHIATCYCELKLAETRNVGANYTWLSWRGFGCRRGPPDADNPWRPHYLVSRTLSQYCAYLLWLVPPLLPGNSLMAKAVSRQVYRERNRLLGRRVYLPFSWCTSTTKVLVKLEKYRSEEIQLFADEAGNANTTILRKGAEVGMGLITAARSADSEALWKFLSDFWAGFVVHLAESTKASRHKMYLTAGGELSTHLWALLSHAGYLGATAHGDQTSDTVLQQPQPYNPNVQL